MKKFVFVFTIFICGLASAQNKSYLKLDSHGRLSMNGKRIKKHKQLKELIENTNDLESNQYYKHYRKKQFIHNIVDRVRYFGFFYGVINEPFNPIIQPIPLAVGLGASGIAIFTKKSYKIALKDLMFHYNELQ